jgi:hypothetical protein
MNIRTLSIIALALLAAACGKQESPHEATAPAQEQAQAAPAKSKAEKALIADGVVLPFRHVVRSRKSVPVAGPNSGNNNVLRVEFQGMDSTQVGDSLRKAFARKSYKVAEVSEKSGVITFVARNDNESRVRYVITPAGPAIKVELLRPDSQGMVTFFWKD